VALRRARLRLPLVSPRSASRAPSAVDLACLRHRLHRRFDWTGTRDFSAWLAAGAGIRFLHELGADAARRYCHELVVAAAEKIARAWASRWAARPRCTDS